jgi:hypothetical protein
LHTGQAKDATGYWILVPGGRTAYFLQSDEHPYRQGGMKARDCYIQISGINGAGEGPRSAELHVSVNAGG